MKKFGLNKRDKLCNSKAIDFLFSRGQDKNESDSSKYSSLAYPLRAVWTINNDREQGSNIQFFISVPKKRIRHAVDRVTIRRRIREAYRLNHNTVKVEDNKVNLAIIYISDSKKNYTDIEKAILRIFSKIEASLESAK